MAQTDEPQVWFGSPGVVGTERTRQKLRHRVEILRPLPVENTGVNIDSLPPREEARVLCSAGDSYGASRGPSYPPSRPGIHHQPAQRHQVFPLPACNGHVHPEALCWSAGIQVNFIWHHY